MPPWLQWSLIILGLAAITLLLAFIVRHSRLLREHRRKEARAQAFQADRRDSMIESIRILAMAVEEDQVEYSEACLRIKGLLDHVDPGLLDQPPYQVFLEIHDQIQHMPTHQARQDTDSRFVRKMDEERFALEQTHSDAIRRAATAIRHHRFD
jgi:heme exporter protein D